jgi:hypothetical protein
MGLFFSKTKLKFKHCKEVCYPKIKKTVKTGVNKAMTKVYIIRSYSREKDNDATHSNEESSFTDPDLNPRCSPIKKKVNAVDIQEQEADQEIEQEIEQEADQEIEQETAQEADQEIEQEIEQEADQEIEQEIEQETAQEADQEIEQEADQEIEQEADQEIEQEADQEIEQEADQETDQAVDMQEIEQAVDMQEIEQAVDMQETEAEIDADSEIDAKHIPEHARTIACGDLYLDCHSDDDYLVFSKSASVVQEINPMYILCLKK